MRAFGTIRRLKEPTALPRETGIKTIPQILVAALAIFSSAAAGETIGEITVEPASIELFGPAESAQVLVHGKTADGRLIDLTTNATFRVLGGAATASASGLVSTEQDGLATLEIDAGGRQARIPITVERFGEPRNFDFEQHITPILNRFGCNGSACHGKAGGQNGFQLSVFGFDPRSDFETLTVRARGRRLSRTAADASMFLLKASGELPHEGGAILDRNSREFETLRDWIEAGAPLEAEVPRVMAVRVSPGERSLQPGSRQQLRVVATDESGREIDVTALSKFETNRPGIAEVDENGLITIGQRAGQAAIMARYLGYIDTFEVLIPGPEQSGAFPVLAQHNFIDEHVDRKLAALNLHPSRLAGDSEFLRRAFLDIIGTLPTSVEARAFLADKSPDKRAKLVDGLLDRPEFVDYWALRWADQLRVDSEALGAQGAFAFYQWIRQNVENNAPWDEFVRQILTADGPLGQAPAGHFYKVTKRPGDAASTLSQVFLGVRITCAECHHHPFDKWEQDDYYGMQAYFQPVSVQKIVDQEFIVAAAPSTATNPRTKEKIFPHPLGTARPLEAETPEVSGRESLAAWLTSPENPWFAQNLANRLAAHFFGRGLIEPIDDVRDTNPPSNPELLAALAKEVVAKDYDIKAVIRTIAASRTYQLSSEPNSSNLADEENYSRAWLKRLPSEVLLDAVSQVTGIPEKFMGTPPGFRAIQLWDSQVDHYFLKIYGRPIRATACTCERGDEVSIAQVMHLMNSPQINAKIGDEAGRVARLVGSIPDNAELIDEIYLTTFSRFPDTAEKETALAHFAQPGKTRQLLAEDLTWSLMNALEFVFNH